MKHLIMFLLCQISLDGFGQTVEKLYLWPDGKWSVLNPDPPKTDTTCESMHLSIRDNGFVIARKALSVQRNGICIGHLQSNGRPFPVRYRVGWCEGKERVWKAIVELLNRRP